MSSEPTALSRQECPFASTRRARKSCSQCQCDSFLKTHLHPPPSFPLYTIFSLFPHLSPVYLHIVSRPKRAMTKHRSLTRTISQQLEQLHYMQTGCFRPSTERVACPSSKQQIPQNRFRFRLHLTNDICRHLSIVSDALGLASNHRANRPSPWQNSSCTKRKENTARNVRYKTMRRSSESMSSNISLLQTSNGIKAKQTKYV